MSPLKVMIDEGEGPGVEQEPLQSLTEENPIPSPTHSPPQWSPEASEDQEAESPYLEFTLGPTPELGLDIKHFFQEQASGQGEGRGSDPSQEPLMEDFERWVEWRGQMLATPTGGRNYWRFQGSALSRN